MGRGAQMGFGGPGDGWFSLWQTKKEVTKYPQQAHPYISNQTEEKGHLLTKSHGMVGANGLGADLFSDLFLRFYCFRMFLFLFPFFIWASKMPYFTALSREIDAFYTSPSTSPASFSTSPACPTNIPSITNKTWVTKSKK